jgi:RimJ/RimL family protein N-acetyltransferase
LTKFYIPRIYRKMKMIVPISISLFRYLFRLYGYERLTLDVITESEVIQEELQVIGFKLEKVQVNNDKKYRQFSLKKTDFYNFLDEMLPKLFQGQDDPISVYK